MAHFDEAELQAKREYAQLLRLHDRLLVQVQRVLEDLTSAQTEALVKDIRNRTGNAPDLTDIQEALEESSRALKLSQSSIRGAILDDHHALSVDGVPDLPSHLQRFLAERTQFPGFSYEVVQDEVRGWVICWKEYTSQGTVRGSGQFYERPYAYLED
jgi:hypothetical protein